MSVMYFTLTAKGGNTFHQSGESLRFSDRIVNIGETPDCDIRYEGGEVQSEYYASILRNDDGESWRIVKRSSNVQIHLEGRGDIGYAHQLKDGDIIQFDAQPMSLTFRTHKEKSGNARRMLWQIGIAGLIIAATVFGLTLIDRNEKKIAPEEVEPLEESIYMVKVDSVQWVKVVNGLEEFLSTKVPTDAPIGTAFHTTDGRIVTARHCVEYWIGESLDLTTNVDDLDKDDIVYWAIETETYNQTYSPDSSMCMRVYFTLYDFMGNKTGYSFVSTNERVHMNTEKDGVYLLADFSNNYYWRSIRPYFMDRQMELGDILWIDSIPESGKVQIASEKDFEQIQNGTALVICGYPMTDKGSKSIMFTEGTLRRSASEETTMLSFEGNINHGFSGGPVLMKSNDGIVAIGVVSRVDSVSSGLYKSAVPTVEIGRNTNMR